MDKTKVPEAVKDRGQTFFLRTPKWEDVFEYLYKILEKENIRYPVEFCDLENATGGLFTIAQKCSKSIRRAVSSLEQVIYAEAWSEDKVTNILDIFSEERIGNLVIAILTKDISSLFKNIKWNDTLILEVRTMLLDIYKCKIGIDILLPYTRLNFIKGIANNYSKEHIKYILNILFSLNKYNYWHEKLLEYNILRTCEYKFKREVIEN
jgi:DNA polymerase III gamma/tau subunit